MNSLNHGLAASTGEYHAMSSPAQIQPQITLGIQQPDIPQRSDRYSTIIGKSLNYLKDVFGEDQSGEELFRLLLFIWYFISLYIDLSVFSSWSSLLMIGSNSLMVFFGLFGMERKQRVYIYCVLIGFVVSFCFQFPAVSSPAHRFYILIIYEYLVAYAIVKIEWLKLNFCC